MRKKKLEEKKSYRKSEEIKSQKNDNTNEKGKVRKNQKVERSEN